MKLAKKVMELNSNKMVGLTAHHLYQDKPEGEGTKLNLG